MPVAYLHHRLRCRPLQWQEVGERLASEGRATLAEHGGELFGIWRSQIGRPRDEVTAITAWERGPPNVKAIECALGEDPGVATQETSLMTPTLRPLTTEPPRRQGSYAFRWFETPAGHWDEFLALCAGAWPDFEASYDSQIIGLWRMAEAEAGLIRSLLLTRRPDLAMWERSKQPANAVEAEVRRKLSRRYDLCSDTVVYTTTLVTAEDRKDTARWT